MPADRMARVRARMDELGVDVLLLSTGADLPWLTGYEALETERLTMLVLRRDADATVVVPRLEAARVQEQSEAFSIKAWDETGSPARPRPPPSAITRGRGSCSSSSGHSRAPPSGGRARSPVRCAR
jgi:Xaa-Pro aminopeptidase